VAATKKTKISNTDYRQFRTLVKSTSKALLIGLPLNAGGQALPQFQHIVSGASMPLCLTAAEF
jgi:hypothetical protein